MHSDLPERFRLFLGGHGHPSYEIELEDDELVYRLYEDGPEAQAVLKVRPGKRRWRSFWKRMDELGAWGWLPDYPNPGVTDGIGWEVEIQYAGRRLRSSGNNNYPQDGVASEDPDPSPEFRKFCVAVRKLLGYIPFE